MKKRISCMLAVIVLLGLLTGCGSVRNQAVETAAAMYYSNDVYADYEIAEEVAYSTAAGSTLSRKTTGDTGLPLPENRKWVITMGISAETNDLDAALSAISTQIKAAGGYIENQQINSSSSYRKYRSASLTVRIPAEQADSFVTEVSGFTNVTSNSRNVHDITLSYSDTEGRVKALKTEEQRLLELMEKAENMSDLLEIEGRLTEVRYQLENYASQLRLYDNQVNYATVDLYISEVEQFTPVEERGFWQRISEGLSDSIVDLGETIVDAAVWFIVDLPYLIALALIIWGAAVIVKRIAKKKKAKKAAAKAANV